MNIQGTPNVMGDSLLRALECGGLRSRGSMMANLDFVSLFSGAGGLDIGLEQAGLQCRYASDIDAAAVETLRLNKARLGSTHLQNAVVEHADVSEAKGTEILAKADCRYGDISLLVGGPPCQSWSSAGHQKGWLDPRGRLFDDFVRLASEMDVRWLMFENVRGLLTARGPDGIPGSALGFIRTKLLRAGFQTQVQLLNAADFGVPQRRVRLFVFGYRAGDEMCFPSPDHQKAAVNVGWIPLRAALDAVLPLAQEEIIRPNAKLAAQLMGLPPGSGVKSPGKRETTRPGGHWGYKQGAFVADTGLPARTVTANPQQDWVKDDLLGLRRLCPRECAAIQTFPSDWIFAGSRSDQYRLIGNAVPPRLATKIAGKLREHLLTPNSGRRSAQTTLAPLQPKLAAAIRYTAREEFRNGASRKEAPSRRRQSA